jgi:hypothetical protein
VSVYAPYGTIVVNGRTHELFISKLYPVTSTLCNTTELQNSVRITVWSSYPCSSIAAKLNYPTISRVNVTKKTLSSFFSVLTDGRF